MRTSRPPGGDLKSVSFSHGRAVSEHLIDGDHNHPAINSLIISPIQTVTGDPSSMTLVAEFPRSVVLSPRGGLLEVTRLGLEPSHGRLISGLEPAGVEEVSSTIGTWLQPDIVWLELDLIRSE